MDIRSLLNGQLKLRHLVLVLTIAEQGSIVAAAKELYVTQPVISRGLREVEEVLGAPLFERTARGVRPTAFAEVFIEHARAVVGHLQQATQHIAELADATVGSVTIGTHVAGANLLVPRAIARLKQERPKVGVYVREATPDRLANGLVSGDIDVVVGRLTPRPDMTDLRQVALYHEPFRVVARSGHPVFDLDHTSLPVLRGYPWVMPVAQTALRGELERAFAREHLELPEQQVDCSSPLALRTIVAETDFLAVQPYTIAVADPLLHIVDVRLKGIGQTVGVTTLPDRPPSPSAALLLRCFEEVATDIRKSIGATTGTGQAVPAGAAMP
ncbi:LysR substrate-binding domain-containing protein [Arthrobacter mobilis]|uniref:LysR family transcriptional regulator n=1 Tax=Arthrobacter mobilis TaxID=2724944 RepID=A0A7X6HEC5_9MICC|nr:LysR substrate-binding domain-containing protein [Arthrobacter mobilis]NKX55579.1 LysR family transcriptional regulator [Arthrobacter mobilis]